MDCTEPTNIVVVGASAGGLLATSKLLSTFKEDLNAAVFIVIHISRNSIAGAIVNHLQKQTPLHCRVAVDGEAICNKTVYLAPPDHQVMVDKNRIIVQKGAYENHYRPSIDVLFRSAAATYGSCVSGIILSGMLDDGTSGMSAIKRSGGTCFIQSPEEAEFSNMPTSVRNNMEVDYIVPVVEMGYILTDLLADRVCVPQAIPEDVKFEAEITKRMSSNPEDMEKLGTPTMLTCPDCGGVIRKVTTDALNRYRCFTGHSFSEKSLEQLQIKNLEESLWAAIRMMEERRNLLLNMGPNEMYKPERALQIDVHVERLKAMLQTIGMVDNGDGAESVRREQS
jgi:two-component system chemotaxis response regulator CheB